MVAIWRVNSPTVQLNLRICVMVMVMVLDLQQISSATDTPRPIDLLEEYQLSFVELEAQEQVAISKEKINGPHEAPRPLKSPVKVLIDNEMLHLSNHSAEPFEWILAYTGVDIAHILIIIYIISPYLIDHFVANYIFQPLKPNLVFKKNEEFPIIPLVYLQETKAEQRIVRPKRNTIEWIATRYLIMASDNVVDLKKLNYSDEKNKLREKKHHPWFILRLLTRLNGLYTRNRIKNPGVSSNKPKAKVKESKHLKFKSIPKIRVGEVIDLKAKTSELLKLKQIRAIEMEKNAAAEIAADIKLKEEFERAEAIEPKHLYKVSYDATETQKYKYENRHPKDRASIVQDGRRVRRPGKEKKRTSLEIVYEGFRRAITDPLNTFLPEDLRRFSNESFNSQVEMNIMENKNDVEDTGKQKNVLIQTPALHKIIPFRMGEKTEIQSKNKGRVSYDEQYRKSSENDNPEEISKQKETKSPEDVTGQRTSKEEKTKLPENITPQRLTQEKETKPPENITHRRHSKEKETKSPKYVSPRRHSKEKYEKPPEDSKRERHSKEKKEGKSRNKQKTSKTRDPIHHHRQHSKDSHTSLNFHAEKVHQHSKEIKEEKRKLKPSAADEDVNKVKDKESPKVKSRHRVEKMKLDTKKGRNIPKLVGKRKSLILNPTRYDNKGESRKGQKSKDKEIEPGHHHHHHSKK